MCLPSGEIASESMLIPFTSSGVSFCGACPGRCGWPVLGIGVPSCGAAAHTGQAVIVPDVTADPRWAPAMSKATRAHFLVHERERAS